jgi:hypothetical protein
MLKQAMIVQKYKSNESKCLDSSFQVYDDNGTLIGAIVPIDHSIANDLIVLEQLTNWRKNNATSFFTQFLPTVERTRLWLRDVVLPDPTKILFLVEDTDGRKVGQFGLCGITTEDAELDNAIRGESGGHPQLFYFVELTIIRFCFEYLGVKRVVGNLFSNNHMSLFLHKSIGFTVEKTFFLQKTVNQDGIRFYAVKNIEQSNVKIQQLYITLNCEPFYERFPKHV